MALTDIQIHELYPEQAALNEESRTLLAELNELHPKLAIAREWLISQRESSHAAVVAAADAVQRARNELESVQAIEAKKVAEVAHAVAQLEEAVKLVLDRRAHVKQQYNERNEEIQRIEAAKAAEKPAE